MTNTTHGAGDSRAVDRTLGRVGAALLAALGFLPVASWIPGGLSDPAYSKRWAEWGYGIAICVGVGAATAILFSGPGRLAATRVRAVGTRLNELVSPHQALCDVGIAASCFVIYAVIAASVFSARPLLIDELVQVVQARMYASGHLSIPVDRSPEFFSILHVVDIGDRMYSQFPPGWPAMLAIGVLTKLTWLVGPACGAVAVFAFAKLLRRALAGAPGGVIVAGTALFGLAPFAAFQFSSHMSHGPVLMWLLIALLALDRATGDDVGGSRVAWAVLMGFAAGAAFAVRPLDAVAFAMPAGVWLAWRANRESFGVLTAAAVGFAPPFCAVLWVNASTTGSPFLFGYEALWGASHGLGFHAAPWGDAHTPQRGLELLSAYVTRLNVYLFETPFPSLLPVLATMLLGPRLSRIERYLFVATALHAALYFAYWHDGFFLGPRFVVPWLPLLVVSSVRLLRSAPWAGWSERVRGGLAGGLLAAGVLTVSISLPVRIAQYRAGLTSMRTDYAAEARRAGVTNSLVFVRESWGAQLVARLWALGVSREATAALYSGVDACLLEHAVAAAERGSLRGDGAEQALRPLLRDSRLVRASSVSPDTTERMLPGMRYDETCSARVAADREGYALYPPLLLENETGNIYVRDFQERDSVIRRRYPDRRAYLLRRDGVDGTAPLRWLPLNTDGAANKSVK